MPTAADLGRFANQLDEAVRELIDIAHRAERLVVDVRNTLEDLARRRNEIENWAAEAEVDS